MEIWFPWRNRNTLRNRTTPRVDGYTSMEPPPGLLESGMARSKLLFAFAERPEWRKVERTTSGMLDDLVVWRKEYEDDFRENSQAFINKFAKVMAVDYIQNLNSEAMVGTQTREETEEVLNTVIVGTSSASDIQGTKRKETVNTYKAMEKLYASHEAGEMMGILSVGQICSTHKILVTGLHPNGGEIRKSVAYTHLKEGPHFYPPPESVEGLFYAVVDHHNVCIQSRPSDTATASVEYTSYLFKCAARLLFELVDVHPFEDSNSRLCRLLANHIVGLITPFPVSLYYKCEGRNQRKDYIKAIVHSKEHGPGELAAMLVEGAWHGWRKLLSELKGQQRPVPIVVRKSQCDEQYMLERINRVWSHFERRGVTKTKEEAAQIAVAAVLKADLKSLGPHQYLSINVLLDEKIQLLLEVSA